MPKNRIFTITESHPAISPQARNPHDFSEGTAVRVPRFRFTIQWMMVAIVVVALEVKLADWAMRLVSDLGDGQEYISGEAVMVWAIPNGLIALIVYICPGLPVQFGPPDSK